MHTSREERETTILYTQAPEDAQISTSDPRLIHRLRKLGIAPDHEEREGGRIIEAEFSIPKTWVKISPPRQATSGQRESARRAMEQLNQRRTEAREQARNAPRTPRRRRPAHKEG